MISGGNVLRGVRGGNRPLANIRLFQMMPSIFELVRSNSLGVEVEAAEARAAKKTSVVVRKFILISEAEKKEERWGIRYLFCWYVVESASERVSECCSVGAWGERAEEEAGGDLCRCLYMLCRVRCNQLYLSCCMRPKGHGSSGGFCGHIQFPIPVRQSTAKPCGLLPSKWGSPFSSIPNPPEKKVTNVRKLYTSKGKTWGKKCILRAGPPPLLPPLLSPPPMLCSTACV